MLEKFVSGRVEPVTFEFSRNLSVDSLAYDVYTVAIAQYSGYMDLIERCTDTLPHCVHRQSKAMSKHERIDF